MHCPQPLQSNAWIVSSVYVTTASFQIPFNSPAKTPAKLSAYQIPSAIVVFVILGLVCKFYSQKPQQALNLLVTDDPYWAPFYVPLYACFTQFSECTGTDCKWNGITKKKPVILLSDALWSRYWNPWTRIALSSFIRSQIFWACLPESQLNSFCDISDLITISAFWNVALHPSYACSTPRPSHSPFPFHNDNILRAV
jgi:hypothetical protein